MGNELNDSCSSPIRIPWHLCETISAMAVYKCVWVSYRRGFFFFFVCLRCKVFRQLYPLDLIRTQQSNIVGIIILSFSMFEFVPRVVQYKYLPQLSIRVLRTNNIFRTNIYSYIPTNCAAVYAWYRNRTEFTQWTLDCGSVNYQTLISIPMNV